MSGIHDDDDDFALFIKRIVEDEEWCLTAFQLPLFKVAVFLSEWKDEMKIFNILQSEKEIYLNVICILICALCIRNERERFIKVCMKRQCVENWIKIHIWKLRVFIYNDDWNFEYSIIKVYLYLTFLIEF